MVVMLFSRRAAAPLFGVRTNVSLNRRRSGRGGAAHEPLAGCARESSMSTMKKA
jgi:hypothetical protein